MQNNDSVLLRPGARGDEVRDLQRRLRELGFGVDGAPITDEPGLFGETTAAAVVAFQTERSLDSTGEVDQRTWTTLVEASYRLGDRALYRHAPMLRGDDVHQLQLTLGGLGFDAGWVDGIFGPDTERALKDFQRNAGLTVDGIAGPSTLAVLDRFGAKSAKSEPVVGVRERERLLGQAHEGLVGRRIVVGEIGGVSALVDAVGRALRHAGAHVLTLHDPDVSDQARAANTFEGAAYLGLEVSAAPTCALDYFATEGFISYGGRSLAARLACRLATAMAADDYTSAGVRRPILRETRMPAAWCRLGPTDTVVTNHHGLAVAIVDALDEWCVDPLDDPATGPQRKA